MVLQTRFRDSQTKLELDLYIKSLQRDGTGEYIIQHREELLPDWVAPPQTIIFLFFQCHCPLDGTDLAREQLEKDRLLWEFNQLGSSFYSACDRQGILAEIICPRDGFPQYSRRGKKIFSIPRIVVRHLPSFTREDRGCGLIHPSWGRAVYPCVMLSLASEERMEQPTIETIANRERVDRLDCYFHPNSDSRGY